MGSAEVAKKNLELARQSPDAGKHGPWLKTLEANRQREEYLKELAKHMPKIIEAQIENVTKASGYKERQYVLDQFAGKAVEKVEIAQVTLNIDV